MSSSSTDDDRVVARSKIDNLQRFAFLKVPVQQKTESDVAAGSSGDKEPGSVVVQRMNKFRKKPNRILSDSDSEPEVPEFDKNASDQLLPLPVATTCNNDAGLEVADLQSRIRSSYITISKSTDIVASFSNSTCPSETGDSKPTTAKNDLNGGVSMVSFKRKRPIIFSSDDDGDCGENDDKLKKDSKCVPVAGVDSRKNGESAMKDIGNMSCKSSQSKFKGSIVAKCREQNITVEDREKSLTVLRGMFPVFDYMECQEVLAVNSWSLEASIKFLTALPNEEIDGCLSDTQEPEDNIIEGGNAKKSRIRSNVISRRRKGVKFVSDSDSDEDVVYKIKPPLSDDQPPKPKREKREKKKKRKKMRVSGGSDSSESYDRNQDIVYDSEASDDDATLTPARNGVLDFFQTAKIEELLTVPGCSRKKTDIIVSSRPFVGWLDLVQKFVSGKGLSTDMLNSARFSLNSQKVVTKLMQNCEQLAKRMESQVARLMEDGDFDEDEGHLKQQPNLLNPNLHLTPYQLLGVNWLLLLHRQKVNGILADEMGLGKTIQATAFLTHLLEEGDDGPHLIVVPASTVDNWIRELNLWSPKLQTLVYQGNQMERKILRNSILTGKECSFNVIVASYNLVISSPEDRSLFRRVIFNYVIFDEAHLLKNMETQRYQNLMKINATRRLLLTGTPLQNNLVELMSLLVFTMPNMFDGKREHLKMVFSMASKDDREETKGLFEKERISHAKQIMKPFVLRRFKSDVLRDLPKKAEEVAHCPMNEKQDRDYRELLVTLARQARENKELSRNTSGIGMVMQLRKLANHPLLLRYHYTDDILRKMSKLMLKEPTHRDANAHLIFEDMQVMSDFELNKMCGNFKGVSSFALDSSVILDSGKLSYLNSTLPTMKSNGDRVLLFSQFVIILDVIEEYMKIVGHTYLRLDGSTPVSDRLELIDKFTNDDSIFVFLLSTKAGGLGINLTAANTVILHDIDFNPHNDKQAEDRCHRVGQTKNVRVIRLISKDSIEDHMMRMATKKLELERNLASNDSELSEGDSKTVASLLKQVLKL